MIIIKNVLQKLFLVEASETHFQTNPKRVQ